MLRPLFRPAGKEEKEECAVILDYLFHTPANIVKNVIKKTIDQK